MNKIFEIFMASVCFFEISTIFVDYYQNKNITKLRKRVDALEIKKEEPQP